MSDSTHHPDLQDVPIQPFSPIISQKDLARYRELKPLAAEFERLREYLKFAVGQGREIEPGPLTARLDLRPFHPLRLPFVFEQLDLSPYDIEALHDAAPEVLYRYLHVMAVANIRKRHRGVMLPSSGADITAERYEGPFPDDQ